MGSASMFFSISPIKALLGDINPNLVDTFLEVQRNPEEVSKRLQVLPLGESSYYDIRSLSPERLAPSKAAARFIYLNRYCFNGLYRTNLKGQFNVPYAKHGGTGSLVTKHQLITCSQALTNASIKCCDFMELIDIVKAGDFVYLDPPFATRKRRVFKEYGPNCFDLKDFEKLAGALSHIHSRSAHFVMSYADCTEARQYFSSWTKKRVRIKRHIAGFAANRRHAYELIVTNIEKQ